MPKIETLTDILRAQRQAREEAAEGVHIRDFDKIDAELQKELAKMVTAAAKAIKSGQIGRPGVRPQYDVFDPNNHDEEE